MFLPEKDKLIREDNFLLGYTYTYTYDDAGNILSKKRYAFTTGTLTGSYMGTGYTYGGSTWGDLLTYVGGNRIEYDEIGNPTRIGMYDGSTDMWYYAYELKWEGRELISYQFVEYMDEFTTIPVQTFTFTYNADGIRTSKTVDGVEHTYILNGSQILMETWSQGGVDYQLSYVYDVNGAPRMLRYRTSEYTDSRKYDDFYLQKNLHGDIVAIYNAEGEQICSYIYDAWGNCTVSLESGISTLESSIANTLNPFRYRGYYLDVETGLYYLQSRYYNPNWGRFISPDNWEVTMLTLGCLTDKNLYAYCDNNPVMRVDQGGQFWETFFDVVSLGASIVEVCINPADLWAWAGLVGDAVDLIPFVTGVGEVTKALKTTQRVVDGVDSVVDAAKATYKAADAASAIKKATGTYEILYKSGKNYVGKGGFKRAISSAVRNANKHGDEVVSIMWKSNNNPMTAFIEEYALQTIRGVNNASTYNKIWSPGKTLYKIYYG